MYRPVPALVGLLLLIGGSGCGSPYAVTPPPAPPLVRPLPPPLPDRSPSEAGGLIDSLLTREAAVSLALARHPSLRMTAAELRAREAEVYQAGRLPNPELDAGLNEFGGTGGLTGVSGAEVEVGVSQAIELGGDRRARITVAARGADLAAWSVQAARLDLITEVEQAYAAAQAAATRRRLAAEQAAIAERFADAVARRAQAGATSGLEARRAAVAAATSRAEVARARRMADAAYAQLATLVGRPPDTFTLVPLASLQPAEGAETPLPSLSRLLPLVGRNPDVARFRTARAQAEAQVALARAERVPDPTIKAGAVYLREMKAGALTAGLTIPLPVFDTNRGAIAAAQARVAAMAAEADAALLSATQALTEAYATYAAASETARLLRFEALPAARAAYDGVVTGYREGEFDLLAVLDAQRTLVETQNALADALADAAQARAAVERLIATPLHLVERTATPDPDHR